MAVLVAAAAAGAQAPPGTPGERPHEIPPAAQQVFDNTMSPFCPELLLANCPSPQADSLRRAIVRRAGRGESRARIEADLLSTYGDVIRAAPARRGFGLVAWVTPGLVLAAGAWGVARWIRRTVREREAAAPPAAPRPSRSVARPAAATADAAFATADELAALDALVRRDDRRTT